MFKGEELSIEEIRNMYPPATLEEQGYFGLYELDFKEWYFDPEYCEYARLEDYQRIALPNTVCGTKAPCNYFCGSIVREMMTPYTGMKELLE